MISFTDVTEYLSHSRNWAENFRVSGICKLDNNNILISGIVPCRDKLNAKATQVRVFWKMNVAKEIFVLQTIQI